jgi:hypothetical protein
MSQAGRVPRLHVGEVVDAICTSCGSPLMKIAEHNDHHPEHPPRYLACVMPTCSGTASLDHMTNNGE